MKYTFSQKESNSDWKISRKTDSNNTAENIWANINKILFKQKIQSHWSAKIWTVIKVFNFSGPLTCIIRPEAYLEPS